MRRIGWGLSLGLFLVGCGAGVSHLPPVELGGPPEGLARGAGFPSCELASAAGDAEPTGFGFMAGVGTAALGAIRTKASEGNIGSLGGQIYYGDLFYDALVFSTSFILRRPQSGAVALGDSYAMGTVDIEMFGAKPGTTVSNMTLMSFWLDGKTMLAPQGTGGQLKPYVRVGVGVALLSAAVTYNLGEVYRPGWALGVRVGLGIEWRRRKFGLYADIGPQMTNPMPQGGAGGVGLAEPLFRVPGTVGVAVNF